MFEALITVLYVLGALMSGAFVVTWYPLAFRALARHRAEVSMMRIVDYAGLHLFVFLSFMLVLRTLMLYGVSAPQDEIAGFGRLLLPLGVDVIVGLRLWKWSRRLWENRHSDSDPELLSGVSKDSAAPGMPH